VLWLRYTLTCTKQKVLHAYACPELQALSRRVISSIGRNFGSPSGPKPGRECKGLAPAFAIGAKDGPCLTANLGERVTEAKSHSCARRKGAMRPLAASSLQLSKSFLEYGSSLREAIKVLFFFNRAALSSLTDMSTSGLIGTPMPDLQQAHF